MEGEKILRGVIEKAIQNGWKPNEVQEMTIEAIHNTNPYILTVKPEYTMHNIIFDMTFAKAFFGEICDCGESNCANTETTGKKDWRFHLQQMILEEDPLLYLSKFI